MINYGKNTFDYEYFGVFYEVEGVLNSKLNFAGLKEEEIKEVLETPVAGLKLSERLYDKHLNDIKLKVKGAITEGLINNKGYGELAKNLSDIGNSNYNNNVKIAVTEAGRIKSLAKQKGLEEAVKSGVSLKKKWIAVSDKKTRADHQQLNEQVVDIDGKFHLHGYSASQPRLFGVAKEDIGCRCDCETVVEEAYNEATNSKESIEAKKYDSFDEWYKDRVSKNEGLDINKPFSSSNKVENSHFDGKDKEEVLENDRIGYNGVNCDISDEYKEINKAIELVPKLADDFVTKIRDGIEYEDECTSNIASVVVDYTNTSIVGKGINSIYKNNPSIVSKSLSSAEKYVEYYRYTLTDGYIDEIFVLDPIKFAGNDVNSIKNEMSKLRNMIQKTKDLAESKEKYYDNNKNEPSLQKNWLVENCAEVWAVRDAILKGAKLNNLVLRSVEIENGVVKAFCKNCKVTFENLIKSMD